MNIVAEKV